jgi:hypothetical protein
MTIGPNSDVTINQYVYDPSAGTGKLAVRVGKGVLRFVGGQVSHTGDATVTTPAGSIGIRGGTGIVEVHGNRARTINLYGSQTINSGGRQAMLYRPGYMVDVSGASGPGAPEQAHSEMLGAYNNQFQARPGQTGGRRGRLTARLVDKYANAHNVTGTITTGSGREYADAGWPNRFESSTTWQSTYRAMQQGEQSAAAIATAATIPRFNPMPTPPRPRLR